MSSMVMVPGGSVGAAQEDQGWTMSASIIPRPRTTTQYEKVIEKCLMWIYKTENLYWTLPSSILSISHISHLFFNIFHFISEKKKHREIE